MLARTRMMKGTLALSILLSACSGGVSSTGAQAAPPGFARGAIVDELPHAGGGFVDGYSLGLRNGRILADRLRQRTVDDYGCSAVGQLQSSLLRVVRSVRPPSWDSDLYVAGFYSGYLDSIRDEVSDARRGCGQSQFYDGSFAGQLYGAVACQVQTFSLTAVSSLQIQPLYDGWSGGSSEVQSSCRTTLTATIESCASSTTVAQQLEASLSVSCSDSVSFLF
jgi:hypothetical protein